jgi:hypothetical protein
MATNTYVALDKKTLLSNVTSVEFTGISSAYTDLVLVGQYGSTASEDYLQMVFNSDTATNYSSTSMQGNGSTALGGRSADRSSIWVDWNSASTNALSKSCTISIFNYRSTTLNKNVLIRDGRATSAVPTYTGPSAQIGLWRKTPEAITSILLKFNPGNSILAGSTFSLYGILREGVTPAPKATGGAIYSDSTYYYHVFGSTGVFTPSQSISADILVVAGGGAGGTAGQRGAGGGGAGGLIGFNSQSLTATNYAVTVGGGGAAGAGGGSYLRGSSGSNSQFAALTAAVGGGAAGTENTTLGAGLSGGSGGGGGGSAAGNGAGGAGTSAQGNAGGNGYGVNSISASGGGGGGAGAAGANASDSNPTAGGVGSSTYSSWGLATGTGENVTGTVYYAGGGSGAGWLSRPGGFGGGGASSETSAAAKSGMIGTGGGGGGNSLNGTPGSGGSGIVIVRYAKA